MNKVIWHLLAYLPIMATGVLVAFFHCDVILLIPALFCWLVGITFRDADF